MTNIDIKRRRRVLLATNSVAIGGLEKHVELIAKSLDRGEFEVFAVTPAWQATTAFSDAMATLADHHVQITPDRRNGLIGQLLGTIVFFRQVRRWKIDVAHFHSTTFRGQFYAIVAARLAGVKHILITEHLAPDVRPSSTIRLERHLVGKLVSTIVCVSEKNRAARSTYLSTPAGKAVVVENGVDVSEIHEASPATIGVLRAELRIGSDELVIGTAVRLEAEKGIDHLLVAFADVHRHRAKTVLVIVGDGRLRAELTQKAEALGIAEAVRWCGFQPDPFPYLCLMDVFVLPVPVGSMSIGLLEAMSLRRAVVITFGGKGEAVEHGVNGYCAEAADPVSIATHIELLLADAELRSRFGAAARERVSVKFSAKRVADRLSELYRLPRVHSGRYSAAIHSIDGPPQPTPTIAADATGSVGP